MKRNLILISALLLAVFLSCKEELTDPVTPKPVGWQEDIPWPSLAASPWPMLNHDPQTTGRGNSTANIGQIKWEFNFTEIGEDLVSGVVVGADSSIYFLTEMFVTSGLYCLDHSGNQKWKVELGGGVHRFTTPIITADNNILVLDYTTLKCFNAFGESVWAYSFGQTFFWIESPQIDKSGNIYLIDSGQNLYKISSSGILLWQLNDQKFRTTGGTYGMAFSPDGKTLYVPGSIVSLLAIDIETTSKKWDYGQQSMSTSPILDSKGNIYCQLDDRVVSLKPDGSLRWQYIYNNFTVNDNKPTIDKNGNIYFMTEDSLYSLDYNGLIRWGEITPGFSDSPLICDENGNIYAGFNNGNISFVKFSNTGLILWENILNASQSQLYTSAVISYANTIIFPTEKKLYAIK